MSLGQERLWFFDRLMPGQALYNMAGGLRLRGTLDVSALSVAFGYLRERHESLRTAIVARGRMAVAEMVPQRRSPVPPWPISVVDLSALPRPKQRPERLRLEREEAARPFNLGRAPLMRLLLLKLGDSDHQLVVTVHHIVFDGWSQEVLLRELGVFYSALSDPLPALPIQPADHAVWQRQQWRGAALKQELDWWREELRDARRSLELPTDRARPTFPTFRGGVVEGRISGDSRRQVEAFAGRQGVTPHMIFLAVFQALLARHSGQDDLLVGTPVASRPRQDLEGLLGFFVNTLVMRADFRQRPSFSTFLEQTKTRSLNATPHSEVPFDKLVEAFEVGRDASRMPLVQVIFALANRINVGQGLAGLDSSYASIDTG